MSMLPNSEAPTVNMWVRSGQDVTSVLRKTARGLDGEVEVSFGAL